MQINLNVSLYVLAIFSALFFQGCGGGTSTGNNPTQQQVIEDGPVIRLNSSNIIVKEPVAVDSILINERKHISLSAGVKQKLHFTNNQNVTWSSNNPAVQIDTLGYLFAPEDKLGAQSQAVITATPSVGNAVTCNVTIVKWQANLSSLTIEATPSNIGNLITKDGSTLYVSSGPNLYSSTNGLQNIQLVTNNFPTADWRQFLIKTDYSHYLRSGNALYETGRSFANYQEIATNMPNGRATEHPGLKHAFAYDVDNRYIYAGEYTLDKNNMHSVYRGTVSPTGLKEWQKVYEFDSANTNSVNSVLHIHVVTVDPYTGNVWIGTGDNDNESRLYYSKDHGASWELFAIGAQYFRILSMWFTEDYVYWNTDSDSENQVISRVKRTKMINNLTPRLESGQTKAGVRYFVYKSNTGLQEGRIYDNLNITLNAENIVYAIDDPQYDYREVVAELTNGSHWYHMWVKDDKGEDLVIMSAAPEGEKRDQRARLFGIKEKNDTTVDVQELFSFGEDLSNPYSTHMQFEPGFQDDDGYIYFQGRSTKNRIYKTKLHWKDR